MPVMNVRDCPQGWRDNPMFVDIRRPGPHGNPVTIGKPCPACGEIHGRTKTIACYRRLLLERIETDPDYRAAVAALAGKILVCCCKPRACHGDVLEEVARNLAVGDIFA